MVKLTINGERKFCPENYDEVKTGLYERMIAEWDGKFNSKSLIKLFSILTETDFETVSSEKNDKLISTLAGLVGFIAQSTLEDLPLPNHLVFKGKKIILPKQLGKLTFGQNLRVHQMLSTNFRTCLSDVSAVYLQPLIDNSKYNDDRVDELILEIKELPVTVVYPISSFFIKQLSSYGTKRTWLLNLKFRMKRWLRFGKTM